MPSARLSLSCFLCCCFKCFRGFGFVHFTSFFYSHATHLSLQNLVWPSAGMHACFLKYPVVCFGPTSSHTHFLSEMCSPQRIKHLITLILSVAFRPTASLRIADVFSRERGTLLIECVLRDSRALVIKRRPLLCSSLTLIIMLSPFCIRDETEWPWIVRGSVSGLLAHEMESVVRLSRGVNVSVFVQLSLSVVVGCLWLEVSRVDGNPSAP